MNFIESCQLSPDTLDIWQFPLTTLPEKAVSLLNKEEHDRANRFYFSEHQRRFIVARAVMRCLLGVYLRESPTDIDFDYNEYGKPTIIHASNIQFSLSHSQDIGLLAVGQEHPLGVDIEHFSGRPFHGIAQDMFSEREYQAWCCLPDTLKTQRFFNLWTQKEAYIKACGASILLLSQHNDGMYEELQKNTWQIHQFMPAIACSAAVCFRPERVIRFYRLDVGELLCLASNL